MKNKELLLENIESFYCGSDKPNSNKSILLKTSKEVSLSETIGKIVSSRFCILDDASLIDLVDTLTNNPEILSIAVIDRESGIKGIILRKTLLSLFSRAFGREIFSRETVLSYLDEYPYNVQSFDIKENIFTVAELVKEHLDKREDTFFLVNKNGAFYGIFNSKDLLVYLAGITQQDFALSRKVQSKIVKEKDAGIADRFTYSAVSSMALDVGGDFYTVKKINTDNYFIALCDVSGKGIAASLISSLLYGFINNYNHSKGLKQFVIDLNTNLFTSFSGEKYVTGIFITFNDQTGLLTMLDMGHSHFSIITNNKIKYADVSKTNVPLGISNNPDINIQYINLLQGDRIFLSTDGLLEQDDIHGNRYSIRHVNKTIYQNRSKDINEISKYILKDFNTFRDGVVQHDDITYILCEYPDSKTKHLNKEKTISNNISKQIQSSIYNEKPLQIRTSRYHPKTRSFVNEMLKKYLSYLDKLHYEINIAYCIHELASNAKKANIKRIYFKERNLDIFNTEDYEKGMTDFKADTASDISYFLDKQKNEGFYIQISFLVRKGALIIAVRNNSELTKEEKEKIESKLIAANKGKDISKIYNEIEDNSEGAGLGIVMMDKLLKSIGSGNNFLTIESEHKMTAAVLYIHF